MRSARSALTLVEVVAAVALLVSTLLVIGMTLTQSVRSSGYAHGLQAARQASAEVVERMRVVPRALVVRAFWLDAGVTTTTIDSVTWVVMDAHTSSGIDTLSEVRSAVLDVAIARGVIGRPGGSQPLLALRFLSELEYNAALGTNLDLDLDGDANSSLPAAGSGATVTPRYAYHPVVVRVAWMGDNGEQVHTLMTAVGADLELDGGS